MEKLVADKLKSWINGLKAFATIVLIFLIGFGAYAVAVALAGFIPGVRIASTYADTIVFGACAWAAKDFIAQTARSVL